MEETKSSFEYGTFSAPRRQRARSSKERPFGTTWMSRVDDDTLVSAMTIPGTHDSAAYTYPVPFLQTQSLDINHQLELGIRYFDLRCGLHQNELQMVHGPTLLGISLRSVLDALDAFLKANPSEALIIQIKKDRATDSSHTHFSSTIQSLLSAYPIITTPKIPTLSQLRSRILLFRRFITPAPYGIDVTPWPDNPTDPFTITTPSIDPPSSDPLQITVQDHYLFSATPLPTLHHQKSHAVTRLFQLAQTNPDHRHFYINFASASEVSLWYRYSPREVAVGGYFGWKWVWGVNGRVREWMGEYYGQRRLGIVVLDFVGGEGEGQGEDGLVEMLIRSNGLAGTGWGRGWWSWLLVVVIAVSVGLVVGGVLCWLCV